MIRTEEILIIPQFTGQTTGVTQSDLQLQSGYWVYSSSFGGNLVDELNVRDFLDNSNNEKIATEFFDYLQSNYSKPEFNELYYDNFKLANILNDYYSKTVLSNLAPTKVVANLQLTATTAVTYTNTNFINYNQRSPQRITAIVNYNTGDSYYISVPINSSYNILDNQNYDQYRKDALGALQQYSYFEWFRYAYKKNTKITNDNTIIHLNSFDAYVQKIPIGLHAPQLRIQFKNDKFIIKGNNQTNIPIEIVFDKPSSFQGQTFQIKIDSASGIQPLISPGFPIQSPILIGTEIGLADGQNNDSVTQNILIFQGQMGTTITLIIKSQRLFLMPDLNIKLTLLAGTNVDYDANKDSQLYSVSNDSFSIFTEQIKDFEIQNDFYYDYVKNSIRTRPQYLLQSFVDINFNDSESEFYSNKYLAPPALPVPPPTTYDPNANQVDLTKNILYVKMLSFGYALKTRTGLGGSIITMGVNVDNIIPKFNSFPEIDKDNEEILFNFLGYNLITFNVNDINETNIILGALTDFWAPNYVF